MGITAHKQPFQKAMVVKTMSGCTCRLCQQEEESTKWEYRCENSDTVDGSVFALAASCKLIFKEILF